MNATGLGSAVAFILQGLGTTVAMVFAVFVIATPCALGLAILMSGRSAITRGALRVLSALVRGVPPLLLLFAAYFVLPILGITLAPFDAAVAGLSVYITFYFAECIRAGIDAVPRGQHEAIAVLGLPPARAFRRVLLPQIIPVALPPFVGYATEIVKASALASAISVADITANGYQMIMATGRPILILAIVGGLYAALDAILMALQWLIARRFPVSRATSARAPA